MSRPNIIVEEPAQPRSKLTRQTTSLPAIYELDGEYLETRRSAHKDEAKKKDD
jgi:hypothetical protein